MKNKKGFTLIELLAVIVILAIIALIAVPVIMNIINKANKSAFKDTVYGVISAGELYFSEQLLDVNGMEEDKTFDFSDKNNGLQIKGALPQSGSMTVTKEGKIAITASNGRYCVTKGFDDTDVTVTEDVENCVLSSGEGDVEKTLSDLAREATFTKVDGSAYDTPTVTVPECITNKTKCDAGIPVAVEVTPGVIHKFYVISDNENTVTLIMDRNLGDKVAWYADAKDSSYGPITAVNKLDDLTADEWSNIPFKNYVYKNDASEEITYESFTKNMRARLPRYSEIDELRINNSEIPNYLGTNFIGRGDNNTYGYWTSGTFGLETACDVHYYMNITIDVSVDEQNFIGIRPVIELSK